MNGNSPITARLIFWPVDRDAVWLKAQFTPKILAEMCRDGDCPLKAFLYGYDRCPAKSAIMCDDVTAKDWIRFLSVGAPIGGRDESAGNGA